MRKRTQKKGKTNQRTENLKLFLKIGNGPKKKRKLINKLRIYKFFWKYELDPKKEEADPKKGETDQQTEKKEETDPSKQETNQM